MRTTLTLDDTLVRTLRDIANRTNTPFKDVVDRALREGIDVLTGDRRVPRAYQSPTARLGVPTGVDLDKARHLVSGLEDEEVVRKVMLRK